MTDRPSPAGRGERLRAFGAVVRTLRTVQGLSQAEVGARIGADQNGISQIERGRRDVKLVTIVALASALGVRPSDLLRDKDDLDEVIRRLLRAP